MEIYGAYPVCSAKRHRSVENAVVFVAFDTLADSSFRKVDSLKVRLRPRFTIKVIHNVAPLLTKITLHRSIRGAQVRLQ